MPRLECTVCRHPDREAIDEALRKGSPPMRELAKQSGLSLTAVFRHKQHIAPAKGAAVKDIAAEIVKLRRAQANAKRKRDTAAVLSISREIRAWLSLEAKAESVAVLSNPEEHGVMTRAEAVETAKTIIEAELSTGGEEIISWFCGLLERAGSTFPATVGVTDQAKSMTTRDELFGEPLPTTQMPLLEQGK